MIRLFRKIRYQLLSEDKYSTYMLYASGEVLLVVIGILLALQIDSWNQGRLDTHSEKYFLNQMLVELASDSLTLHQEKIRFEGNLPMIESLLEELHKEDNMEDFNHALRSYLNAWAPILLPLNNSTFEEMKSSNKLGIIKDRILRNNVISIYSHMNQTQLIFQANSDFLSPIVRKLSSDYSLAKYLTTGDSMFGSYISEEEVYQLKEIKDALVSDAANWHWTIVDLLPLIDNQLDEIRSLMHEIEDYIN